jgi:Bacterial aa3 type cytochrome c oxidase subunit IV
MSEAAHDYHPGDQDVSEQDATYNAFGKLMKWGSLTIAVLLIMLVMWFCVSAGFFAGLGSGLVVLAVGIFFLRSKPTEAH